MANPAATTLALLLVAAAPAQDPAVAFPSVVTRVGDAEVDWTHMVLVLSEAAQPLPGARSQLEVVEQQARAALGPRMLVAAGRVRIDAESSVLDIIESETRLGKHLDRQSSSWHVTETRYFSTGRVEIDAELDLASWLAPVLYARASREPSEPSPRSRFTGVLVDARGLDAQAALAPRLLSPAGEELYAASRVHEAVARESTPVVYVTDPADPRAVERCGASPLLLRAGSVSERVDLVLTPDDAIRFTATASDALLMEQARVVLVLDP